MLISDEIHEGAQTDGHRKINDFTHTEYRIDKPDICKVAYTQTDDGIKGFKHQKTRKEEKRSDNGKIRHGTGLIHIIHIKQQMPEQNRANADHVKPMSCCSRHITPEIND